jgi:hypothetical protein
LPWSLDHHELSHYPISMRHKTFMTIAATLATLDCRGAALSPAKAGPAMLLPGDARLRALPRETGEFTNIVSRLRPGLDSTERTMARMRIAQEPWRADGDRLLFVIEWPAPFTSTDSLVVERRTLAPVRETLALGPDRYAFTYSPNRVVGVVAKRDSGLRAVDRPLSRPAFAFNELTMLVAALEYSSGRVFILPLFSEVDGVVEYDTLTVLNRVRSSAGAPLRTIRFADPAVVTEYVVDEQSRRVLQTTSRNRTTGTTFFIRAGY